MPIASAGPRPRALVSAASLAALAAFGPHVAAPHDARAAEIPITSVAAFPNGRTTNELPPNAIDGDTTTWTWTTNPNNTASPSHLAIGFALTRVHRIRLWKERQGGGGQSIKNLVIQYTTDASSVPLSSRTWITVTGLRNGFQVTEHFDATSVDANGTVTGDIHDSPTGDGWGSLTFTPVDATGLRISFSNPNPNPGCTGLDPNGSCNHYRVAEFEAHGPDGVPGVGPWGLGLLLLAFVTFGAALVPRARVVAIAR